MVAFCAKPSVKFLKKGIQDFTTMVDSDMDQNSGEEAVLARGMRDGLQHIEAQAWLHSDEHMGSEEEADVARGDIQDRGRERYIQDWRPANDVGYIAAPPNEPVGIVLWPQRRPRVSDQEMLTRGIQEGVLPSRREGGEVQQSAFASMVDELASVSEDEASEEWSQIAMTPGSMAQSERDGQRGHPPLRMRRLREATPEGRSSVPTAVRRARAAGRVHLTSTDDVHRCGHCHEMTPPVHGYCLRCEGMVFCSEECLATHLYSVHREIDVKGRVQQAVEVILVMLLVACMLGAFESLGAEAADDDVRPLEPVQDGLDTHDVGGATADERDRAMAVVAGFHKRAAAAEGHRTATAVNFAVSLARGALRATDGTFSRADDAVADFGRSLRPVNAGDLGAGTDSEGQEQLASEPSGSQRLM